MSAGCAVGCGPPCAPPSALCTLRAAHTRPRWWPGDSGRRAGWRHDVGVMGEGPVAGAGRRDALRGRLASVQERIAAACAAAGRDPGEVTLVAITKTYPASDVRRLFELGVRDVGENRD